MYRRKLSHDSFYSTGTKTPYFTPKLLSTFFVNNSTRLSPWEDAPFLCRFVPLLQGLQWLEFLVKITVPPHDTTFISLTIPEHSSTSSFFKQNFSADNWIPVFLFFLVGPSLDPTHERFTPFIGHIPVLHPSWTGQPLYSFSVRRSLTFRLPSQYVLLWLLNHVRHLVRVEGFGRNGKWDLYSHRWRGKFVHWPKTEGLPSSTMKMNESLKVGIGWNR